MTATTYVLSATNVQSSVMSTTFITHDPNRYLKRDWKSYSPHIPKHSSLPVLRLVPVDRPLFVCENCGSSNIFLPLCLWCKWTSDSAKRAFENATPLSRRLSAPGCNSEFIKRKKKDRKRRGGIVVDTAAVPRRSSLDSRASTEPPVTPCTSDFVVLGEIAKIVSGSHELIDHALAVSHDPTVSVALPFADDRKINSRYQPSYLKSSPAAPRIRGLWNNHVTDNDPEGRSLLSSCDMEQSPLCRQSRSIHTECNRNNPGRDNGSVLSEPTKSSPPWVPSGGQPMQRPISTPPSGSYRRERPLYHYIRNNSSQCQGRSGSPFDYRVAHDLRGLRETGVAETRDPYGPQLSPCLADEHPLPSMVRIDPDLASMLHPRHALIYSTEGFSVSGETEQRMKLARRESDRCGDYKFQEVRIRKRDRIRRKVEGVRRCLNHLFSGRV